MAFDRDFHFSGLFKVEIEGLAVGEFQEVNLPSFEVSVIDYNHGGSKSPFKRPGAVKWGNLTLKRGYNVSRILQEWHENIAKGVQDRRSISVIQHNEETGETMRWNFFNCWPCKWSHSPMAGAKNEVSIETIEMVVERGERAG